MIGIYIFFMVISLIISTSVAIYEEDHVYFLLTFGLCAIVIGTVVLLLNIFI